MWDTVDTVTTSRLSHDMPCSSCGHAAHRFLSCSDSCGCIPAPLPGEQDAPWRVAQVA